MRSQSCVYLVLTAPALPAVLKTLVQKLRHDDTVTYTYRRQLLHANIIRTVSGSQ